MCHPIADASRPLRRGFVLAVILLSFSLSLACGMTSAQETKSAEITGAPAKAAEQNVDAATETSPSKEPPPASGKAESGKGSVSVEKTPTGPGTSTITVRKGNKTVTITGTGVNPDREFDSVTDFARNEPAVATAVVAVVALIFLAPVLAIALILVYRMRKARMLNETMLKLAEKGIVPPADALNAVAAGNAAVASSTAELASTASLHERARTLQKKTVWSDLRKGVVMGAIGLGLTSYSLFEDRTPNSVGLVLLFVGIGYGLLWWFEQRQFARRNGSGDDRGAAL